MRFSSFLQVLEYQARCRADHVAYRFLDSGEGETDVLTYSELDRRARNLAAALQARRGVGQRVLLAYPSGPDFIIGLFGCFYAGAIAVPAYLPGPGQDSERLKAICADSGAAFVLTESSFKAETARLISASRPLECIEEEDGEAWSRAEIAPDSIAMIQYTSGSTGHPKGVVLSHANLVRNEELIQAAFGNSPETVVVGWLPMFHDMGLIGNVLQPLFVGGTSVLMPPLAFLQKPARWLRAISKYRASVSGGPNFAYDYCVRRVTSKELEGCDFSSWQIAFNGSEPVRGETMYRFAEKCAPFGFRREVFFPCYGLAEATLFVTGGHTKCSGFESKSAETTTRPSSGACWPEQRVAIVDPDSRELCATGEIGEIWIAGPCVAQGYWDRSSETVASFAAETPGFPGINFLRTGDLGFARNNQLYVTGRLKDVIIIRGRNHHPEDIELSVRKRLATFGPEHCAVFSVELDGEERVLVAQELPIAALRTLDLRQATASIREAIAVEHQLQVHGVLFVKRGSLPKTSSGKLQRRACRRQYLEGTLTSWGRTIPQ